MTDLLTRLRSATEASRELDAEIHAWVNGWEFKEWCNHWNGSDWTTTDYANFTGTDIYDKESSLLVDTPDTTFVPHYTSNLQDALELVPKGVTAAILANTLGSTASVSDGFSFDRTNPALALATAAIDARMKLREAHNVEK